jgi:uncharacterized repeat protein (TIGR03803 family)
MRCREFLQLGFVCLVLCGSVVQAQIPNYQLWGVGTSEGYLPGNGIVFHVNPDGTNFKVAKRFGANPDGSKPTGNLVKAATGEVFGMTSEGGINDAGVIFKMNPDGSGYTKILDFSISALSTSFPTGNLILASNGDLYGTLRSSYGLIFRLHPDGSGFTFINPVASGPGNFPTAMGLIQASDGDLYGKMGESGNAMTIFKIKLDGTGFTKLFQSGNFPFKIIEAFDTELLEGADGYLYTATGDGIIKIKKDGTDFQQLHQFETSEDKQIFSEGKLVQLPNHDLIGFTRVSGTGESGYIYTMRPDGTNYSILLDFSTFRLADLILASSGKLYGIGYPGPYSSFKSGLIFFQIEVDGSAFMQLFLSTNNAEGSSAENIIETTPGIFMGITNTGGASNNGTVFKMTTAGELTKIKDFPQEGADPESRLLAASDGSLYGTTVSGGIFGFGIVYKINTDGTGYTKLYDFEDNNEGYKEFSNGGLIELNGSLYGNRPGYVFKIKPDGSAFASLHEFSLQEITNGNLLVADNGYLYGITATYAYDSIKPGSLYRMFPDGAEYSVLIDFGLPSDIGSQATSLIQGRDGNLYLTTMAGGPSAHGALFKVKPDGSEIVKLRDFDALFVSTVENTYPIEASDGLFYGYGIFTHSLYSFNSTGANFNIYSDPNIHGLFGSLVEIPGGNLFGIGGYGNLFRFDLITKKFTTYGSPEFFESLAGLTAVQLPDLTLGLVACYSFSGNANDGTGNNNNGVVHGATLTYDRALIAQSAYEFTGSNYISIPASSFKNNNYSYVAWVKPSSIPDLNDVGNIISIGEGDGKGWHQTLNLANVYATAGYVGWNAGGYNNGDPLTTSAQSGIYPGINQWIHLVSTRSDSSIRLYVNGILIATASTNKTTPYYGGSPSANIGARSNLIQYFRGVIDDILIYNRTLSAWEVLSLYNGNVPCGPPVVKVQAKDVFACGSTSVSLSASGADSFRWYDKSGNLVSVDNPFVTPVQSESTIYFVIGTTGPVSSPASKVHVTIFPAPELSCMFPATVNVGESKAFQVRISSGTMPFVYSWDLGDTLQFVTNNTDIIHTYNSDANYLVTAGVIDGNGCPASCSSGVDVKYNPFIPNVITVNQDAFNSMLTLYTKTKSGYIKNAGGKPYVMHVYDRWGKEVFTTQDIAQGWNGEDSSVGIYFYSIQRGTDNYKGWVDVLH